MQVLEDAAMTKMWEQELKEMSNRIIEMRFALVKALQDNACPPPSSDFSDWSHITSQIGMFAYTGLNEGMCDKLTVRGPLMPNFISLLS